MGLTLPPGIWHTSQCMPTQCPSWVSPGSCSNPWSWLEGCSQCVHLHWWNRGSCIHLEFQPLENRHHFSMKFEHYSKITSKTPLCFILCFFYKPPASHRLCGSSWCWAEGCSRCLCGCSAPMSRFLQEQIFFQQHRWNIQTWLESQAEVQGLPLTWLLALLGPLAKCHCTQRAQVPKAVMDLDQLR